MPATSKDQGCFCCPPTAHSVAYSQEMASQQFQIQTLITTSPSSTKEANYSSIEQNISTDANESPWLQDISLNNTILSNLTSPIEWNHLHENDMQSQVIHEIEMCQIQDLPRMPMSAIKSVTSDLGKQSSSFNIRILQNREISGNMFNGMKPLLLSSDVSSSPFYSERIPENGCDNTDVSINNTTTADSMDLDSALDELGMLSTVTNSRKQYLLETRGNASSMKHDQRLRSKSESSPNLSTICRPTAYHIVQVNSNIVASLSGTSVLNQTSSLCEKSPCLSEHSRLKYRNPNILDQATRHQRYVPRMTRMRKDRYIYRRSRCPYKIPNRQCTAIHETSPIPEYFSTYASSFATSATLSENVADTHSGRLTSCQQLSESTSSAQKSYTKMNQMLSLSAEDLAPLCRCLEKELNNEDGVICNTEQSLDSVTSQMTNLHMS